MIDYESARKKMVQDQIIARGIRDRNVINALETVPRHSFVEESLREEAYDDNPLPIGEGQTISQPYMVAVMTELLDLKDNDRVLEIGTGSGYQAAVLTRLCSWVYTVERVASLTEKARTILSSCGYENVTFKVGDGSLGWPEEAPFDGIIVTAGSPKIPEVLVNQLAENGKLVIPVGNRYSQTLQRLIKRRTGNIVQSFTGCRFVDLIGKHGWSDFDRFW